MIASIENTSYGYVVQVYLRDEQGCGHWYPLRNFGDREGDAKEFLNIDLPELSDTIVRHLAKRYDKSFRYVRVSKNRYFRQRPTMR